MSRPVYFLAPLFNPSEHPWGRSGLLKLSVPQIQELLALMERARKRQQNKKNSYFPGATPSVTTRSDVKLPCWTFQEPVFSLLDEPEQVHPSALDELRSRLTPASSMQDGDRPEVELYVCAEGTEYTQFDGLEGFHFGGDGPTRADLLVALMRQADSEEDLITLWERLVEADPKAAIDTLEDNLKGDPREDRNGGVCGTWTDAPDLWAVFGPEEVESLTRHDHPDIRREARQTAYEVGVIPSRKPSSERPSLPSLPEAAHRFAPPLLKIISRGLDEGTLTRRWYLVGTGEVMCVPDEPVPSDADNPAQRDCHFEKKKGLIRQTLEEENLEPKVVFYLDPTHPQDILLVMASPQHVLSARLREDHHTGEIVCKEPTEWALECEKLQFKPDLSADLTAGFFARWIERERNS